MASKQVSGTFPFPKVEGMVRRIVSQELNTDASQHRSEEDLQIVGAEAVSPMETGR
jgi:hypothetical protein